ncbi:hypothetical protein ACTJJB_29820 [Chitinophaga sp. 22536]
MRNILKTKTAHHKRFVKPVPTEKVTNVIIPDITPLPPLRTFRSGKDGPY